MTTRTLRGVTWRHERGLDPMIATAGEYAALHPGVKIEWTQRSLQAFADQPTAELVAEYDMIVIDHPHVGEGASTGTLLPLDEVVSSEERADLASRSVGRSHDSYNWQGRQWALAIDAAAQVSAYRPDLLDAAPKRWDQVVELAVHGRVLWPLKPVDAVSSFFTLCANRGTPVARGGDILVSGDDAHAVLDAMVEVATHVPPSCLSMNPIEALDLLSTTDDFVYAPLLYGYSNYSRTGFRHHLLSFADIPALGHDGPVGSMLGGAGLSISARCSDVELASDYVMFVADGRTQRTTYVQAGGQPAHADAWDDGAANSLCHNFFKATRQTLESSWLRPRHSGYVDVQALVGDLVTGFLSGDVTRDRLITEANMAYRESLRPQTSTT